MRARGDFVMAFVTTPTLRVEASPQRYEHVSASGAGSVVRYISRDGDFTAELEVDADGLLRLLSAPRGTRGDPV